MIRELAVIPPFMRQARKNLTGNARDLWVADIRDIRAQLENLGQIRQKSGDNASLKLLSAVEDAEAATAELLGYLEARAPEKTGPSGVGRENCAWYQQQVHYVPLSYEQEEMLLQRELDRAWSSLTLEEHSNRLLPPQRSAGTEQAYDQIVWET